MIFTVKYDSDWAFLSKQALDKSEILSFNPISVKGCWMPYF